MTSNMRKSLALLGGTAALFASIVKNKGTIYNQCVQACPKGYTLRQWLFPLLHAELKKGNNNLVLPDNIVIVNPWVSSEPMNVPVSQAVLDKFESVLSNF